MSRMSIFVENPWLALVVGGLLTILWWWSRSRIAAIAAACWAGYAGYESLMLTRILCTGDCNIRIDLLVIYPALLIALAIAVVAGIRARAVRRPV